MLHSPGPVFVDFGQIFNLGISLPLRWYGLLTGLGFLTAIFLLLYKTRNELTEEQRQNLLDLLFWCFLGGIIGARLWFVLLNLDYFSKSPVESLYIWQGGQSIQGGFLGGILTAIIFHRFIPSNNKDKYVSLSRTFDLSALVLPIGQAIGRWGNFFNTEAFGKPTDLPWGLYVPPNSRPLQYSLEQYFHPTFAYESLFLLTLAALLWFLDSKKKLPSGSVFWVYLILYSLGRFFLEFLRTDSLYIGSFPAAQVICVTTIILSAGLLVKRTELLK